MALHIWNTARLVSALSAKTLSSEEKFQYLLLSYALYAIAGYLGALVVVASEGWLFWFEGILVLVITVLGLMRCRDEYRGAADDRLLENSVILGVPLGIKLYTFSWLTYVAIDHGIQWVIYSFTDMPSDFEKFLLNLVLHYHPFAIAIVGQMLYFWRLSVHLKTVAENRAAPNKPPS